MKHQWTISEARGKLPTLIQSIKRNPDQSYEITLHGEPVAILRASLPKLRGGEAAEALLRIATSQPAVPAKKKRNISGHIDRFLYRRPH